MFSLEFVFGDWKLTSLSEEMELLRRSTGSQGEGSLSVCIHIPTVIPRVFLRVCVMNLNYLCSMCALGKAILIERQNKPITYVKNKTHLAMVFLFTLSFSKCLVATYASPPGSQWKPLIDPFILTWQYLPSTQAVPREVDL